MAAARYLVCSCSGSFQSSTFKLWLCVARKCYRVLEVEQLVRQHVVLVVKAEAQLVVARVVVCQAGHCLHGLQLRECRVKCYLSYLCIVGGVNTLELWGVKFRVRLYRVGVVGCRGLGQLLGHGSNFTLAGGRLVGAGLNAPLHWIGGHAFSDAALCNACSVRASAWCSCQE